MACTLFREASTSDGKPGDLSYRRVASGVLIISALLFFGLGLLALTVISSTLISWAWMVFIPGALCLLVGALMPILTTISDIKILAAAITGKAGS